jgi:hypothetical protein
MSTLDTLRLAEARVRAKRLGKEQKYFYLRQRGWRRVRSGGTQTWRDLEGKEATLAGATVLQLQRDMNASHCTVCGPFTTHPAGDKALPGRHYFWCPDCGERVVTAREYLPGGFNVDGYPTWVRHERTGKVACT